MPDKGDDCYHGPDRRDARGLRGEHAEVVAIVLHELRRSTDDLGRRIEAADKRCADGHDTVSASVSALGSRVGAVEGKLGVLAPRAAPTTVVGLIHSMLTQPTTLIILVLLAIIGGMVGLTVPGLIEAS